MTGRFGSDVKAAKEEEDEEEEEEGEEGRTCGRTCERPICSEAETVGVGVGV